MSQLAIGLTETCVEGSAYERLAPDAALFGTNGVLHFSAFEVECAPTQNGSSAADASDP